MEKYRKWDADTHSLRRFASHSRVIALYPLLLLHHTVEGSFYPFHVSLHPREVFGPPIFSYILKEYPECIGE